MGGVSSNNFYSRTKIFNVSTLGLGWAIEVHKWAISILQNLEFLLIQGHPGIIRFVF